VLGLSYNEYALTDLTLVNNIFYNNRAWNWQQSSSAGNSVALDSLSVGLVLFSGAFSGVSGSQAYHYLNVTPGTGCITEQILQNDPPMFVDEGADDYHLKTSTPFYTPTPIDHGLDPGQNQYFSGVPEIDLDGLPRPVDISTVTNGAGGSCDMGAYEAQQ
jgi:hypothetical protein